MKKTFQTLQTAFFQTWKVIYNFNNKFNNLLEEITNNSDEINKLRKELNNHNDEISNLKDRLHIKDNEISNLKDWLSMIENSLEKIGEEFNCPITGTTIKNPIITPDGFLYEESSIKNWIKNMSKDPISISP